MARSHLRHQPGRFLGTEFSHAEQRRWQWETSTLARFPVGQSCQSSPRFIFSHLRLQWQRFVGQSFWRNVENLSFHPLGRHQSTWLRPRENLSLVLVRGGGRLSTNFLQPLRAPWAAHLFSLISFQFSLIEFFWIFRLSMTGLIYKLESWRQFFCSLNTLWRIERNCFHNSLENDSCWKRNKNTVNYFTTKNRCATNFLLFSKSQIRSVTDDGRSLCMKNFQVSNMIEIFDESYVNLFPCRKNEFWSIA